MKTICVCVCTKNRPAMLSNCLTSIAPARQAAVADDVSIRYVVVDNAPARQTASIVARALPGAVYVTEPKVGVSHARNAALQAALEMGADWIAFIDDDETAAPNWLYALYWQAKAWNADAVHGVVRYRFPMDAPMWRRKAPWSDWADQDGRPLDSAGTGNVLFSLRLVRAHEMRFSIDYNMLGGEDAEFFRRYHGHGGRIVFSTKPVVQESVPWSRITLPGFARKAHRHGALKVEMARLNRRFKRSRYIRKAVSRLFIGTLRIFLAPAALLIGRMLPVLSSGINDIAEGVGILQAIHGKLPAYYETTDGY
jgi:succinoglycan biosynthesis protein ExoM